MKMTFNDYDISRFKQLIEQSTCIVFIPHRNPDGDAIGATLGWWNVLKNKGKQAFVLVPDSVPLNLMWMNGSEHIVVFNRQKEKALQILEEADLLILADFNKLDRCGELAVPLEKTEAPRVVIDHHPFPDPELAGILFSAPEASSTCELSFQIIKELGWCPRIDSNAASCFYAGIITDTGSLSYNSSDPETYHTVANLVAAGIDKDEIHKELFQRNTLSRTQLLGHVLCNKLEVLNGFETAFISLSKEELDAHHFVPGDTEGFVNYPLTIDGINISALFTEREKDKIVRISFRSRCQIPVNDFAEQYFSGGGHPKAAGGEWKGPLKEAIAHFKSCLPLYLKNMI